MRHGIHTNRYVGVQESFNHIILLTQFTSLYHCTLEFYGVLNSNVTQVRLPAFVRAGQRTQQAVSSLHALQVRVLPMRLQTHVSEHLPVTHVHSNVNRHTLRVVRRHVYEVSGS